MEPQTSEPQAAAPAHSAPASSPMPAPGAVVDRVGGAPVAATGQRFVAYLLEAPLAMVTLGIGYLIWSIILWGEGQTPGKKLMGLRVVKLDTGKAATRGTMFLREFIAKPICMALFAIPFLISIFGILGASRRGVWDKMAGTIVVEDKGGMTV